MPPRVRTRFTIVAIACSIAALSGCATSPPKASSGSGLDVVASINAWGSILAQLGGDKVHETSIITNPATDPHDYEPTPADAIAIAKARLFVENGIGYDSWASKSVAANPTSSRIVINVGTLAHIPDGGNPHRWYDPSDVELVATTITADLKQLDPADAAYFDSQHTAFEQSLSTYRSLIADIRKDYGGLKVGASESIFAPLASALGLDLITPATFLKAISEGTDPSPADLSTIDRQIATKEIKVYVFNTQNSTPDVQTQVDAARKQGIPIAGVTETLSPASDTFQQWQDAQLVELQQALARAKP